MIWLIIIPLIVLLGLAYVYSLVKPLRNAPPNDAENDNLRYKECRDLDDD